MNGYAPDRIRNVALVGHNGCGKTTIAETLLYLYGVVARRGSVNSGSTVCDYEPEEHRHNMSISLATAPFVIGNVKVNLIDAPGFADFFGEVRAALAACDLAVMVVSAVDGPQAQTLVTWGYLRQIGMPTLLLVNKLDRENASYERVIAKLKEAFGEAVVPLHFPIGEEAGFCGVIDLASGSALRYDISSEMKPATATAPEQGEIPPELADRASELRDQLAEAAVVADDALMERYLDGEMPSSEELLRTLAAGVAQRDVYPVLCGSAATMVGIDQLAAALVAVAPAPSSLCGPRASAGGQDTEVPCDPSGRQVVRIFKTVSDPYVGKISLGRVLSGTLRPDTVLVNPRTHSEEKLHALEILRGKEAEMLTEAQAGDLFAMPKLGDSATGDTLTEKGFPVVVEQIPIEPAVYGIAIAPKTKEDENKLMTALHRLQDEDPVLRVDRNEETHQTILMGTGDTHVNVAIERLSRKYAVQVTTSEVLVPYKETITKTSQAEGRYKKQTGGHGQYGVASIRMEPLERGAGFVFTDQIVGGAIPNQYIPAVEKGVQEAMASGGSYGYPVVDVHVTCFDGKYHPVDSSELSFKMAGSLAFREALASATPVVLEPISRIDVEVPVSMQGDILADLSSRRGRVQGTDTVENDGQGEARVRVEALVPRAEILRYALDLRALTGGMGRFSESYDHYDVLPSNLLSRLSASA